MNRHHTILFFRVLFFYSEKDSIEYLTIKKNYHCFLIFNLGLKLITICFIKSFRITGRVHLQYSRSETQRQKRIHDIENHQVIGSQSIRYLVHDPSRHAISGILTINLYWIRIFQKHFQLRGKQGMYFPRSWKCFWKILIQKHFQLRGKQGMYFPRGCSNPGGGQTHHSSSAPTRGTFLWTLPLASAPHGGNTLCTGSPWITPHLDPGLPWGPNFCAHWISIQSR